MTLSQLLQLFGPQLSHLGNGKKLGFIKGQWAHTLKPIDVCQLLPEAGVGAIGLGKSDPNKPVLEQQPAHTQLQRKQIPQRKQEPWTSGGKQCMEAAQ